MIQYCQKTDRLIGFCDKMTAPDGSSKHKCDVSFNVTVGNDFTEMERMFQENCIGGYARAILLNPHHAKLPVIAVFLQPTCKIFTAEDVSSQWSELQELYSICQLDEALGPFISEC